MIFYSILFQCRPKNGGEPLRRIQFRNLLDQVQSKLAYLARLTSKNDPNSSIGSTVWRDSIQGSTLYERMHFCRNALQKASQDPLRSINEKSALKKFVSSDEAMRMAVEVRSQIRIHGDVAAHHHLSRKQFLSIIEEHSNNGGESGEGLKAFVDFLFS